MSCHFGATDGDPKHGDQTGNMLACQLCPQSPTYWKRTAAPPAEDPWDDTPRDERA